MKTKVSLEFVLVTKGRGAHSGSPGFCDLGNLMQCAGSDAERPCTRADASVGLGSDVENRSAGLGGGVSHADIPCGSGLDKLFGDLVVKASGPAKAHRVPVALHDRILDGDEKSDERQFAVGVDGGRRAVAHEQSTTADEFRMPRSAGKLPISGDSITAFFFQGDAQGGKVARPRAHGREAFGMLGLDMSQVRTGDGVLGKGPARCPVGE